MRLNEWCLEWLLSYNTLKFTLIYNVFCTNLPDIIEFLDHQSNPIMNIEYIFNSYSYIFMTHFIILYKTNFVVTWILYPMLTWFQLLFWTFIIIITFICVNMNLSMLNSFFLKLTLAHNIWLYNSFNKTDSLEETLCLSLLWPWCIILIFSHVINLSPFYNNFSLAEWSIPVIYGLLLMLNNIYSLGSFFLIFLTGSKTRRSILLTLFEDLLAVTILFLRILLQMVRGVIVGLFHWICRELMFSLRAWWTHDNLLAHITPATKYSHYLVLIISFLILNLIFTAYNFLVITSIMFLQLIFLLIAIWLFCKCWFIAANPNPYNFYDYS